MKIGIVTFWESKDNYGQILQCFALQKFLQNLGYDAFVIRFKKPRIDLDSSLTKKLLVKIKQLLKIYPIFHLIYSKIMDFFVYKPRNVDPSKVNKIRNFDDFESHNIKFSDLAFSNVNELNDEYADIDCLITGSDQVWHYSFLCEDGAPYFLNFGGSKTNRISYAPSFGVGYVPRGKFDILHKNLGRFNHISERENFGKNFCKNVGFDAKIVLDPTMLLSRSDYIKLANEKTPDKYVYSYLLNIKSAADIHWNKIGNYLKEHSLKLFVTNASGGFPAKEWMNGVEYQYSTINQWLSMINNANIFFTSSFHGVVFSILLHTDFIFIPIRVDGANSRIESLLKELKLEHRIWNCKDDLGVLLNSKIDWEKIDKIVSKMRADSGKWLVNSINNIGV